MKLSTITAVAAGLVMAACAPKTPDVELIPAENFAGEVDGKPCALYTLKSDQIVVQATNFGARVVSIFAPGKDGSYADVVAGRNTLDGYVHPAGERFLGACVGPVANRIGGAGFVIDGVRYNTPANDNKVNTLHGGYIGLDNVVWNVKEATDTRLVLEFMHPDGLEGYPGNVEIEMTYSVEGGDFRIDYKATTDKPTPVNISNHPFFNLRGEGIGTVEDYVMYINADLYVPIDSLSIPLGTLDPVEGTPFDFREPHTIGQMINTPDNQQLINARGYDHNWCIAKKAPGEIELACSVWDEQTGRFLEVLTDQPGMQFYSGNFFNGKHSGKNGNPFTFRSSLALETQMYPDTPNQPAFGDCTLRPGDVYTQTCIYRFSVK
ncbi:MAG: galactose mutarotase [Bacteroidales bacterium]|nr:galactose mutarotase [Bacteroidales bacterium]